MTLRNTRKARVPSASWNVSVGFSIPLIVLSLFKLISLFPPQFVLSSFFGVFSSVSPLVKFRLFVLYFLLLAIYVYDYLSA